MMRRYVGVIIYPMCVCGVCGVCMYSERETERWGTRKREEGGDRDRDYNFGIQRKCFQEISLE